jgi:hypothetical protein
VAYPINWVEQDLMFGELADHLRKMALFDVNTGLRDQELCGLQWAWEQRVPELDSKGIQRSVFVLPARKNKNKQARVCESRREHLDTSCGEPCVSAGPSRVRRESRKCPAEKASAFCGTR